MVNDHRADSLRLFGKQHQNFTANLDELDSRKDSESETIRASRNARSSASFSSSLLRCQVGDP